MISGDLVMETAIGLIFLTLILIGIFISSIKEKETIIEERNNKDIGDEKK